MNTIQLNFIELSDQNTKLKIYRKEASSKDDALYYGSLPLNHDQGSAYKTYKISLTPKEDFSEFEYSLKYNHKFSNRILFDKLFKSIQTNKDWVVTINEGYLRKIEVVIEKVSLGEKIVFFTSYYLNEFKKFGFLVDYRFKENLNANNPREVQRLSLSLDSNYRSNKSYYKDKLKLITPVFSNLPTILIQEKTIELKRNLTKIESSKLNKKTYFFKNRSTSNSQFQGIKSFGPYQTLPIGKQVTFYFIFREKHKNLANNIYLALIGKLSPGTFPGLESMFNLNLDKNNVERITLENNSEEKALDAIKRVVEHSEQSNLQTPFVIYIEENNHDDDQQMLYYLFKHEFLKRNIPVQVLSNEKVGSRETLKWSVSSIGLQIFSKLGGIPWIVKPSEDNCLILGIGQAYELDSENNVKKQFAYSVCVDSSGLYKKLEILSIDDGENDFFESIKKNIINLLKQKEFEHYKKCAIHIPFKISNQIIDAIVAIDVSGIELKVIKVNTKNKFFGFSEHNTKVPYESSFIKLGFGEYLVWFEGLNYGKEIVFKRVSNPIHIEFLNTGESRKEDELSYLQDILNLSGANWKGFNTKAKPISIYYSEIIADYSIEFQKIKGFKNSSLTQQNPWFL